MQFAQVSFSSTFKIRDIIIIQSFLSIYICKIWRGSLFIKDALLRSNSASTLCPSLSGAQFIPPSISPADLTDRKTGDSVCKHQCDAYAASAWQSHIPLRPGTRNFVNVFTVALLEASLVPNTSSHLIYLRNILIFPSLLRMWSPGYC